jgi:tetratricopeptide (TPR) repeat protein
MEDRTLGCLEADTVVALVDGTLDDEARSAAQRHLATCQSCSDLVAAAGTSGGDPEWLGFDAVALAKGASFGRYVILDLVGRGGMGEVYAAYDPQLDRKVALKLLRQSGDEGDALATSRARLLREAKAIARLSHPNVVVVHDAGEIDERVFLAMEFVDGVTLAEWLDAQPRSQPEILDAFAAAGAGLAAAHQAGLVHRDFKPQNVMIPRDGAIRVMDFGLASDTGPDGDHTQNEPAVTATDEVPSANTVALTRTGALLGTPLYMAPEQLLGLRTDARTDQFSFCVALYHALYGERPFATESLKALLESVTTGRMREPPKKARVPAYLRRLLLRGLARRPDDRFPSMAELLAALRADPRRRRRQIWWAAAGALVMVVAGLGVYRMSTAGQRLCRAGDERLASAWELVPEGPRRNKVRLGFLASGSNIAEDTWRRTSTILDDYARRWLSTYSDACQATHVRGDQSAEVMDLRMTCLDRSVLAIRALTDVLTTPDPEVVLQAVNAASALPGLERCSNATLLRDPVAPPADAANRTRVETIRTGLANVKALADVGRLTDAERRATTLVSEARDAKYPPVLAEALAALGWVKALSRDTKAVEPLEEAVWTAIATHRDEAALQSVAMLVGSEGYHLGHYEAADRWDRFGQALLTRLGPGHERAASWLLQDRAAARLHRGDVAAALQSAKDALALKLKVLPPDHPDVGVSWFSLASILRDAGELPAAVDAGAKSVAIARRAYGERSPMLSEPLNNYGEVLSESGRHREAEPVLREAIEHMTARFGAEHEVQAYPLLPLGNTLVATGRAKEGVAVLDKALAIRERSEPNRHLIAETRFALARALWEENADRARARQQAIAAREDYTKAGTFAKQVAAVTTWLEQHPLPGGNR